MGTALKSPARAHSQMWQRLVVLRLPPAPPALLWEAGSFLWTSLDCPTDQPSVSTDQLAVERTLRVTVWRALTDTHCWEPPYPGDSQCGCTLYPSPPTGCAHSLRLTFHSKPATARPPAAPEPANPTKRPEPSLLAKSEAPICRGKEKGSL